MKVNFKINFQLQELDKICPFGEAPQSSLHWFGLTDGLLWIDVGSQTIYEYTDAAQQYWGCYIRYNDYQISRFLEDFSRTFKYVGESIPRELYGALDDFDMKMKKWNESHMDEEDDVFESFYFGEYCELSSWCSERSFDSGHLVGGPHIGCFRCEDRIKIMWDGTYKLENGEQIWTSPKGCFEMPYEEFVLAVKDFFDLFFSAMDKQVENAVAKEWGNIFLDKQRLVMENIERKTGFYRDIEFLDNPNENTDWDKIRTLYAKMEEEIG